MLGPIIAALLAVAGVLGTDGDGDVSGAFAGVAAGLFLARSNIGIATVSRRGLAMLPARCWINQHDLAMKRPRVCLAGARLDQQIGEAPVFLRVFMDDRKSAQGTSESFMHHPANDRSWPFSEAQDALLSVCFGESGRSNR
jgi:hypothetical protein